MPDLRSAVDRIYQAFAGGDIPGLLACLHEDVAWESWSDNWGQGSQVPWLAARRGRSGAAAFFAYLAQHMEVGEFRVLDVMVGERQVAVEVLIDVHVPATGRGFRDEEIHLWTFDDHGRVTRLRHYADTAKHIHAAGLEIRPGSA